MNENQHLQIWILNLRLNPRSIHRDVDTVWSAGVKRELSVKGKVMIYHSFSLCILIYDHKLLYGVHFGTSSMIQAAEISIKRNEHLNRMPPGCHVGKKVLGLSYWRRPGARPRTHWRDYITWLAWEQLIAPKEWALLKMNEHEQLDRSQI